MKKAVIGISDHCGWAVLVTVTQDGKLVDRRRVELVDANLPSLPHHSEGQRLPLPEAVRLVKRVQASASRYATQCLNEVAKELAVNIVGIAMRECPKLPSTIAERITNYQAQCKADGVMYRDALAHAATRKGWPVYWYDPKRDLAKAAKIVDKTGEKIGPPWSKDHRLAMAGAMAALRKP